MSRKIFYEATNCRNQCFHCYCPAGSRGRIMMTPDQILDMTRTFQQELKEEIQLGILREPTLYPELLPLLKQAEEAGWLGSDYEARSLYTNGENLSETLLSALLPIVPKIIFTLYGTEGMHEALAGRMGAYHRIEEATKLAMVQGFQVEWRILATKGNEKEIAAIYEKGKELCVHELKVSGRYILAGEMRNAYENIPTSKTVEALRVLGIPYELNQTRPEREYAENPEYLMDLEIYRFDLDHLYVDQEFNVYPLNQIAEETVIGNLKEGRALLMDRLRGEAQMPVPYRRVMEISLLSLAEEFAKPYSEQMLTPQMFFEKYYRKMIS